MTRSCPGLYRDLTDAIRSCLDRPEFGYHELTDAEAKEIVVTVERWLTGKPARPLVTKAMVMGTGPAPTLPPPPKKPKP